MEQKFMACETIDDGSWMYMLQVFCRAHHLTRQNAPSNTQTNAQLPLAHIGERDSN